MYVRVRSATPAQALTRGVKQRLPCIPILPGILLIRHSLPFTRPTLSISDKLFLCLVHVVDELVALS